MAPERQRHRTAGRCIVRTADRLIKHLLGDFRSRHVLLGGFAVLLLACMAFTVWLLLGSNDRIVQGVLLEVANRVEHESRREIRHFLNTPDLINRHTLSSLERQRVQDTDSNALHDLFWDAPREDQQAVSSIYFGSAAGTFAGLDSISVEWPPTAWRYTLSSANTGGQMVYLPIDEQGQVAGVPQVSAPYDPRTRPWYRRAVAQDDGAAVWTDIYSNFDNGVLTLTRAKALRDAYARLRGVAGVDLFLSHLQHFLHTLALSPNGEVFIVEANGMLIGSHTLPVDADIALERHAIDNPRVARFTRAAGAWVDERYGGFERVDENVREHVVLDGEDGYLMLSPAAPGQGLDWVLGVFVPERDYVAPLGTQIMSVLPLGLLGLLFSLFSLTVFARLVAKPLSQLRNGAARIAVGEFDVPIDTRCNNEVGDVARAIDDMRNRLQQTFEQLTEQKLRAEATLSEELRLKSELSYQATHDSLTDLINRREFERRTERLVERARSVGEQHALCYLDLDRFKFVNDSAGHDAGDELLRQIAALLLDWMRDGDTVARLGGDEFGILLEHCTMERATRHIETLRRQVERHRFFWAKRSHVLGISAGLTAIGANSVGAVQLMRDADNACYIAKNNGRNRVYLHHDDDAEMVRLRTDRSWVERIEHAFETDLFTLHAQRIVKADPIGQPGKHLEILLRVFDENDSASLPADLFPAAERYDLAARLDRWVVARTLDWLASLDHDHARPETCSINLSGQSLGDDTMLPFLVEQVRRTGVDPHRLCFEVTETATIANLSRALVLINTLRELGCRFALDDFGSGLSSFAYLKTLPVDYLKIDGLFVRDMLDDPLDFAMVRSINEVGQTMGMLTVAEYVESEAQRSALHRIGVDLVQGYGTGRPEPLDAFTFEDAPADDFQAGVEPEQRTQFTG